MILKIDDAPAVGGGRAVLLCDDQGTPLPNVLSLILRQEIEDISTVTVTFTIDGLTIRFAE